MSNSTSAPHSEQVAPFAAAMKRRDRKTTTSSALLRGCRNAMGWGNTVPVPPHTVPDDLRHSSSDGSNPPIPLNTQDDGQWVEANGTPDERAQFEFDSVRNEKWSKTRWCLLGGGLGLMVWYFALDNMTLHIYRNYAASEFHKLSAVSTLNAANTIVFAITKAPIGQLLGLLGRAQTYLAVVLVWLAAFALMAAAPGFAAFAAGAVLYAVGQSGVGLLDEVIVADATSPRWRAFGRAAAYSPLLATPWLAGLVVGHVVETARGGLGWRWGVAIFACILPACAALLVATLWYYQRRSMTVPGGRTRTRTRTRRHASSFRGFFSDIDFGGLCIFSAGLASLLLPLTLAHKMAEGWRTPWVVATIAAGGVLMALFPFYEGYAARHPFMPLRYFSDRTICLTLVLIVLDHMGHTATHTFLYAWAVAARGMTPRDATFFTYMPYAVMVGTGLVSGLVIARLRRSKWAAVLGSAVRLAGYGLQLRLNGAANSAAEVAMMQVVHAVGMGLVDAMLLPHCQLAVGAGRKDEHDDDEDEVSRVTSVFMCFANVGASLGAALAGSVYTNLMDDALRDALGHTAADPARVRELSESSLTDKLPALGTPERLAVGQAFSQIMVYVTYAAVGTAILGLVGSFFLVDYQLPQDKSDEYDVCSDSRPEESRRRE
ncbi:MFS general substrate transporter [Xylariomycetidae sp. FL0641]|nr:MFS general substrate transporter [Xylariomycetidae sp. FL0641]